MANSSGFSRAHLIYAICLPLAIVVGLLLADPMDSGMMAGLVLVFSVLAMPVLMRWHHPLLVFSCNALVCFAFIPGTPSMWMVMTVISAFFLVLNRSLGQPVPFFQARSVAYSLICLAAVVLATAYVSGGAGFHALGGTSFGGRKYLTLFTGIALFFALCVQPIPAEKASRYMGLYFLSGLTALAGYLAVWAGPAFFLAFLQVFPIQTTVIEAASHGNGFDSEFARWGESAAVALAFFCFLLSRYGVQGVMDLRKPWRIAILAFSVLASLISGFRSSLIMLMLLFAVMFYFEGLLRKPLFFKMCLAGLLVGAFVMLNIQRLPQGMQRSLAFLPLDVDPAVRLSAEGSTQWRLDMWQELLPQIPRHLIKGKGYGLDPDDLYMASVSSYMGYDSGSAGSAVSGDYHSGPLSVLIPFGLPGAIAFIWFLVSSLKVLRQNHLYGDPALKHFNTFLYAFFVVRIIIFTLVFGSLYSDLAFFVAIVGLSVSLNSGVRKAPEKVEDQAEEEEEFLSAGGVPTGF